ncbi:MAG TPA: S8 family serine peptidase [Longimicrobiaceae bacterium]|nr:S8 family serine peptidase [Longimicrobiaceae bacterium]
MTQFRLASLLVAGAVALSACADDATSPSLTHAPAAPALSVDEAPVPADRHIFVFSAKRIPADFEARVAAAGGTVERAFPALGVASTRGLDGAAAASLGAAGDVAFWNNDVEMTLDVPVGDMQVDGMGDVAAVEGNSPTNPTTASFYPRQWHLRQIGADRAWAAGRRGSPSVKVGILDSGIDYRHPDLVGRVDLSLSKSFVPADNALIQATFPGAHEIADLQYHGTHVAATVSSNAYSAAGVTSNLTLVGIKVLNRNGSGNSLNTLDAIVYAADIGLDVINMSLGIANPMSRESLGWFNEMMNRAMEYAFEKGVVVVVSAGNENLDLSKLNGSFKAYCTASTVTCVSATGPSSRASINGPWENIDGKASYSNYGTTHVSIAAPGGNGVSSVTAACSSFSLAVPVCQTGVYVLGLNGTSMASPHAAALAALLVEQVGKRQPALVRQRLQQSADDLGKPGADPIYGKGRINMVKALGL